MATKHLTPAVRNIINTMLAEGKKISEIVTAVKTADPESTIKYENVYNYKKRQETKAKKVKEVNQA